MGNPMDEGLTEPPIENFPPLRMAGERNPQGESSITPLDNIPPLRPTMSTDISPNSEKPEDIYVDMSRPPPTFPGKERTIASKDYPPRSMVNPSFATNNLNRKKKNKSPHQLQESLKSQPEMQKPIAVKPPVAPKPVGQPYRLLQRQVENC